MGDRSNIKIKYKHGGEIYLYGHWMGPDNMNIVMEAVNEGRRIEDESYFTRILFCKMIEHDLHGDSGYGIAPYKPDNEYPVAVVDYTQASDNGRPKIYLEG